MAGGRQKEFSETEVLQKAMVTFWQKGYAGTSLSDLTQSMGINKPSIYATFGNKEQLFIRSLEHYVEQYVIPPKQHLESPTQDLRTRLYNYMHGVTEGLFSVENVKGCFVSVTASDCDSSNLPPEAVEKILQVKEFSENFLRDFFEAEQKKGGIGPSVEPKTLAYTIIIFFHGAASLSRTGKQFQDIEPVIGHILDSIPILENTFT